jgi:hypothetical protein
VDEDDFYYYLSGEDGKDGLASSVNGRSAYELWKEELASRAGMDNALWNYAEDEPWDPAANTLDDFYLYLRGTDGANGKDGKPGLPGEPGAIVTIVKGIPNVIAQYSQSEFSEYVRTTDGGVLYKVYDKYGALAPGAIVKGMPGLDPSKTYTADSKGEFIIPRDELPEIQEVEARWGTVKSVTIKGETLESAMNTYVPNQPHMRMILRKNSSATMYYYVQIYYLIQRKMNPEDEWTNLVSYLPNYNSFTLSAYKLTDSTDPDSMDTSTTLAATNSYGTNAKEPGQNYVTGFKGLSVNRLMIKNVAEYKNNNKDYSDGTIVYYTVKTKENYYGLPVKWNGIAQLPPYQIAPLPKKLHFVGKSSTAHPYFTRCEGEYDFSAFRTDICYKNSSIMVYNPDGIESVSFKKYTSEEVNKLNCFYLSFEYSSSEGKQTASNSGNQSSHDNPTFTINTPYLGASLFTKSSNSTIAYSSIGFGKLLQKGDGSYYIKSTIDGKEYTDIEVTYSEN